MQNDTEARFVRIESTLERLADAQLRGEYALTDAVEHMARSHRQLLTAQVLMAEAQRKADERMGTIARHMDELTLKQAETEDKLNALIDFTDRQTRRSDGNGGSPAV